jgi:hypothetical protein
MIRKLRLHQLATGKDRTTAVFWGILLLGLKGHEVELIVDGREEELPPKRLRYARKHYARIESKWIEKSEEDGGAA